MSSVLSPLTFVFFGLPLTVVTVLLIAAAVLAVRRSRAITFDEERYPGLAALRRATLRARYVGIAGSVIVFFVVATLGRFGQGLFIAPAAAGAVVISAILVGQRLTYTRARTEGIAGVERREVGDYLPARLVTIVAALLLLLVVVAAWTTLVATSDEFGPRSRLHPFVHRAAVEPDGPSRGGACIHEHSVPGRLLHRRNGHRHPCGAGAGLGRPGRDYSPPAERGGP